MNSTLLSPDGIKIEVKSAAYLQSWSQQHLSKINFSIKAARYWDSLTNTQAATPARHADVYIFCLLKHKDQYSLDPMNLDQWEFYVVATSTINNYKRSQTSITLQSLDKLTTPVTYDKLGLTIIDIDHNRRLYDAFSLVAEDREEVNTQYAIPAQCKVVTAE